MGNVIELVARERTYSGREVADLLGIGASTLRKWSMLLEQNGYWFLRDSQNRREYRQMDVAALQRFYRLTKDQLFPQEEAALMIVSHDVALPARMETAVTLAPPIPVPAPVSHNVWEEKLHALAVHVQQQDAAHQALLERVEKQEAYIRSNLKERDRRLMKAMNDIMDAKVELTKMKDEQRKTSIWHKLLRLQ
ncbi:hypothetical protein [Brevibacillus choshinensis]|uniref:hypothetical protein n=1 Tax=Brevibacillus choshinensis TaxID=54911 RepID=UPI002E235468|nr:hypothetical protein [Brevibacillus choshinensis]